MKKFFGLAIIPLALALAGCATCDMSRVDNLDSRVRALESKVEQPASSESTSSETSRTTSSTETTTVTPPDSPSKADIQMSLKNAGYYDGPVDGKFGPKTKKSIEEFQTANELVADGKIGPNTWNKLKRFYSVPTEQTESK